MTKLDHQRVAPARFQRDPIGFIDRILARNEKGQPLMLAAYQRRVLALAFVWGVAALALRLLLWSEPKKSGKSLLAALLVIWWAATRPNTEVIIVAADKEQAVGRVFKTVLQLCRMNGLEAAKLVRIKANSIEFASGTVVTAIASEYRGAAGSRHSLVVYDELWTYDREALERLYEELTPPPTEPDAWVLVVTYAGFAGESRLLETMYQRGLAGERIDSELEVYQADDMVMFWSHTPRQPWQTDSYYNQQRRGLRPATFARLHENRWVSAESTFITAEIYDACVNAGLAPVLADQDLEVDVGVDASQKSDWGAVYAVAWEGARLRVVAGQVWRPSKQEPLDLEHTIEAFVRELDRRFLLRSVRFDPWQLARSAATLRAAGIPMIELPQTEANVGRMGSTLYDLLRHRNIVLYPDDHLRTCALNAVAREHARGGLAMTKKTSAKKIDAAAALAMACLGAIDAGPTLEPLMLAGGATHRAYIEARGGTKPVDDEPEPDSGEEPEVIEATEEEMAARPDADDWVKVDMVPRSERRKRHHAGVADIARRLGFFPEDDAR